MGFFLLPGLIGFGLLAFTPKARAVRAASEDSFQGFAPGPLMKSGE
jgi:hypothetical protein